MKYSIDLIEELTVLAMFDLANHQAGLKIHHSAEAIIIAAAERLHSKGLISQKDGGYLTHLGIEAAEHAQAALNILGN
jgi:uncharacterized protein (TIGR02647 family)